MSQLKISLQTPLAQGRIRRVYAHPDNPEWLIKVMRPELMAAPHSRIAVLLRGLRRLGPYALFAREIEEYLASYAANGVSYDFTQKITGLVETDMGLGIVVQMAKDRNGKPAPTIDDLIRTQRFGEPEQKALVVFIGKILQSSVIVSDLHWRNLVYAYSSEVGDRFIMIDGLGSANLFPLKALFPFFNRRSKLARVLRLKRKIESLLPQGEVIPELR